MSLWVILRGSGRGEALLYACRGTGVIPSGRHAGKRLVGVHVGSGLEMYVENHPASGVFYYDSTIGGPWKYFEDIKGAYNATEGPLQWNQLPQSPESSVSAYTSIISEQISVVNDDVSSVSSSSYYGVGSYNWPVSAADVSVAYASTEPLNRTRRSSRQVRSFVAKKVTVVKERNERKLALDKDI